MLISSTAIKHTRKVHSCEFCERIINIGKSAERNFTVDGSDAWSWYLCAWCAEHINEFLKRGNDYEFTSGDLYKYVNSALHGHKCPQCGCDDINKELYTERGTVEIICCGYLYDTALGADTDLKCGHKWEIGLDALLGLDDYANRQKTACENAL